jgi:CBS domain-containing protein
MLVEKVLPAARERLVIIGENAPVVEAAKLLGSPHTNLVVVCNPAGAMVGVMSKTDIVKHISHCHGHACAISVSNVMTRDVIACQAKDWLHDVWSLMKTRIIQCVPVIEVGSKPQGILYARDALEALLTEVQDEESLLRDYVMSIGYH